MEDFQKALKAGDVSKIKSICEDGNGGFINQPNAGGEFPVHVAAKERQLNVLKLLIELGANVNQGSEETGTFKGYTAAHYSARIDDVDALDALKKADADFNREAGDGWTPLHAACFSGKHNAIKKLIGAGVDVNIKNHHKIPALVFAVNHGRNTQIRDLIKAGAETNVTDTQGDHLMHHCFHYQMSKMFEGEYDMPEVQFDAAVSLALTGVDIEQTNAEGNRGSHWLEEDIPALVPALRILAHYKEKFALAQTEWNYMTLVSAARVEHFAGMGLEMRDALELYDNLQNLEKQRIALKKKKEEERPAGGCPVMRGGKKKKGAAAEAAPEIPKDGSDPSNGQCPFFQKKDGAAAEAAPAGPPVGADKVSASQAPPHPANSGGKDPSNGQCPFFNKGKVPTAEELASAPHPVPNGPAPTGAVSNAVPEQQTAAKGHEQLDLSTKGIIEMLYRNRQTVMMLVIAFFCGIWFEQFASRMRGGNRAEL